MPTKPVDPTITGVIQRVREHASKADPETSKDLLCLCSFSEEMQEKVETLIRSYLDQVYL